MAGKVKNMVERGGRFWARIIVPADLVSILGKTELREPLGGDRREAERRLHAAVARFQDRIDAARRQRGADVIRLAPPRSRPLTGAQMGRTHYAEELDIDERTRNARLEDGTSPFTGYEPALFRPAYADLLRRVASGRADDGETYKAIGWAVDKFTARSNTNVEPFTPAWRELARTLASVQLEALRRFDERDDTGQARESDLPILKSADVVDLKPRPTLTDLFTAYFKELKASGKGQVAERRWRPAFAELKAFLGHEDARRITRADVLRWKDDLVSRLALKTVKDVRLAAVRAIFSWAVDNDLLDTNPAEGVKVRGAKPVRSREQGFNQTEALALLKAAHGYTAPESKNPATREQPKMTAAKRWTPWLAAYTGARISELTQLRREDVRHADGVDYIRITPDAGTVKTDQFRDVPLHPHLVENGFLDFVKASSAGPLFYLPRETAATIRPAEMVATRVSKWIRALDIVSDDVAPNHGWRHRFKTVGREEGMDTRVLDAIQGHAGRTAGDAYGDVTLKAKKAAIEKHPRYDV